MIKDILSYNLATSLVSKLFYQENCIRYFLTLLKKFIPLSDTIFSSICRQDYKFFVYTHRVYLYIHMCKPQWLTVQSVNISQQYFHLCHNTPWKQRMQMSKYESSKTHTLTYFNRNWTKIWHLSTHLYICSSISCLNVS